MLLNLLLQTSQFSHMGQQNLMYCSVMKLTLMYLVAECLARQAKLSSAHFNRDLAHLLSSAGFGPAHNPGGQTFRIVDFKDAHATLVISHLDIQ